MVDHLAAPEWSYVAVCIGVLPIPEQLVSPNDSRLSSQGHLRLHIMAKTKLKCYLRRLLRRLRHERKIKADRAGWEDLSSHEGAYSPKATDQRTGQPGTSQERIVAMTRELGELRESLAGYRAVSEDMFTNLLPVVQVHCRGFQRPFASLTA